MKRNLLGLLFLSLPFLTFAHKVSEFISEQNGVVDVYGYYSDGTPAKHSDVEVYDALTGKLLLKGKTDENGLFEFKTPPGVSKIKVILYAGLGHKAVSTYALSAESAQTTPEANTSNRTAAAENPKQTPSVQSLTIPPGVERVKLIFITSSGGRKVYTFRLSGIKSEQTQKVEPSSQTPAVKPQPNNEKAELQKIRQIVQKETSFPWEKVFCGIGWILGIFAILSFIYGKKKPA